MVKEEVEMGGWVLVIADTGWGETDMKMDDDGRPRVCLGENGGEDVAGS